MTKTAIIIGYGRMGREHERAYQECGVDVIAKIDRGSAGCPSGADFVSVCTHDDSHAEYIVGALQAGCKVIAEKPLCLTEADLQRIYKLATPDNLYCNLPLIHKAWPTPFGKYSIAADYHWGRADKLPGWRGTVHGYSFVLGAGVHMTSLLLFMGGPIFTVSGAGHIYAPMPCPTEIYASGRFVNDNWFTLHINAVDVGPHRHQIMVIGESGCFNIDNYASDKTVGIIKFIRGEANHFDNAIAAHSVCFAIERALKSGRRETVEYLS